MNIRQDNFDIDLFKRINDSFGHLIGDKVLKMVSKEMKKICRNSDFLARYGGEEFVVILPQTNLYDAHTAMEKIRMHVADCPFNYQNEPVPLTISIGIAEKGLEEETESWIGRADNALYEAKGGGRNKFVSAKASAK